MTGLSNDTASGNHLRAVLEHAPVALLTFDRHGVCTMAEGRLLDGDEMPRHLVGRSLGEIGAYFDLDDCDSYMERAIHGDTITVASASSDRRLECRFEPVLADGEVASGLAVVTDVTERARLHDLGSKEARFRAMVRYSADIIAVVESNGRLVEASPAATTVLGLDPDDVVGQDMFDLIHPDDHALVADALMDAVHGTGPEDPIVLRMRSNSGNWRHLEVTGRPVGDDIACGVVVVARDVTDRKKHDAALVASERRYRALAGRASQVLAVVDALGRCTFVDDNPHSLLGWTADGVGKDVRGLIADEDIAAFDTYFNGVVARSGMHAPAVFHVFDRFGTEHYLEVVATNLLDDPHVNGIVLDGRDVTEQQVAEQSLRLQALHDGLTGLANRTLFVDRVDHALHRTRRDHKSMMAVVVLDIDRLKLVNDSLGHSAGDEVLIAIGKLLEGATGPADTIARLTGGEFAVCCENLRDESGALDIAKRLSERARTPLKVAGQDVHLTASIGIALSRRSGDTAEALLRDAAVALNRAKEKDRGRIELFDNDARLRAVHRLEIENGMRAALRLGELRVHHQPVVRLRDGRMVGTEALVRWQHPTRGLLAPDEFIPVAEDAGLIGAIGQWVIEESCRRVRDWRQRAGFEHLAVAVNVSARQLNDDHIVETVRRALELNDLPAAALGLEVTETALMADEAQARSTLTQLHEIGVRLAIDDFGTGYSSLSHLRKFHFDALKIDRSFVAGLAEDDGEDAAIIAAVIALARSLDIRVIAEGVETIEHARKLANLGCHNGQGYLWGRPLPPEQLALPRRFAVD
ncbi:MAG TPA: EAL domain-containing protein [Acidimicrobiales bacterium]